jgi:outer membrane protein assembly factor BamA
VLKLLLSTLSTATFLSFTVSLFAQNCVPEKTSPKLPKEPIRNIVFRNAPALSDDTRDSIQTALLDGDASPESLKVNLADVAEEGAQRVRAAYQDEGYFKVEVDAKAVPVADDLQKRYDIVIQVLHQGEQYWLRDLHFEHMRAFSETELRNAFPIQRGEIFSREKIAKGLENLRQLYVSQGYLNFVTVPTTHVDDVSGTIDLDVDVDEGKQFKLRRIDILGVDPETAARILGELTIKQGDLLTSDSWGQDGMRRSIPDHGWH